MRVGTGDLSYPMTRLTTVELTLLQMALPSWIHGTKGVSRFRHSRESGKILHFKCRFCLEEYARPAIIRDRFLPAERSVDYPGAHRLARVVYFASGKTASRIVQWGLQRLAGQGAQRTSEWRSCRASTAWPPLPKSIRSASLGREFGGRPPPGDVPPVDGAWQCGCGLAWEPVTYRIRHDAV